MVAWTRVTTEARKRNGEIQEICGNKILENMKEIRIRGKPSTFLAYLGVW